MAIYHNTVKVIARSSPRSTLAISAYINRDRAKDKETNMTYDFTKRQDLIYSEILLPENAPEEYKNKEKLWNAVERAENGNGQTARTFEIALPRELNEQEQIKLVQEYVKDNFVKEGMCADIAIHDKGDGNPHAHIMLTMRPINAQGEWAQKSTKVYLCKNVEGEERAFTADEWQRVKEEWSKQLPYYKNGNPNSRMTYMTEYEAEHDERYKLYKRVKGKNDPKHDKEKRNPLTEKWNSEETFIKWREDWAAKVNAELAKKGLPERIDHRSYETQGIEKKPTKHVGAIATQYEKQGVQTEKGNVNRAVREDNRQIEILKRQRAAAEIEIKGIRQDNYIMRTHELTEAMKSAINEATSEQDIIKSREAIERLDRQMRAATAVNYNVDRIYTMKDGEGKNQDVSYVEYHRAKYERARKDILMAIAAGLIAKDGGRERSDPSVAPGQPIPQPQLANAVKTVDIKAVAAELEDQRREYISIIKQINENTKIVNRTENRTYQVQMNQITDAVSEIKKLNIIIKRAESEKGKLHFMQGKEKREKQATIDRGHEQRTRQVQKLRELGVGGINEANVKIAELERRASAERSRVAGVQEEVKELYGRKVAIQREYHTVKNNFSGQQKAELEQYQADYRNIQAHEKESRYFDLAHFTAQVQADRELEPKASKQQEQLRNRTTIKSEYDDR